MSFKLIYLFSFILVLAVFPLAACAQVKNMAPDQDLKENEVFMDETDWEQWYNQSTESDPNRTFVIDRISNVDNTRNPGIESSGSAANWFLVIVYQPLRLTGKLIV